MRQKNKKVICAISGGVDSSVAAAILKRKGYDVVGVFMKFWKEPGAGRENLCCSAKARIDAKRVAIKLGIPFHVLDLRKEFKKRVVDYFIREYKEGRTPNPCVECNRWIKFNFPNMATGHYARIKNGKLLVAKDRQKDQSYFLWTLTQKQLKNTLFPVGDYTKKEIREMAKKWGLPVFEKKDSQEICFINTNIYEFLASRINTNQGPIITTNNIKIGEHKGLAFYTLGQRKGIEIGGIGPFYVVKKDFKNNVLIVAKSEHAPELHEKEMIVEKVNWINKPVKFPFKCKIKIRYLHPANPATIYQIQATKYQIRFTAPQRAITPGQSAVFYKGNEILGGGIITFLN